jgi:hypothetical protein
MLWTPAHIVIVYTICQKVSDRKERVRQIKELLPERTESSIDFACVNRYQKRNDGQLRWIPQEGIFEGFGSNGRKWNEVWNQHDWRQH